MTLSKLFSKSILRVMTVILIVDVTLFAIGWLILMILLKQSR